MRVATNDPVRLIMGVPAVAVDRVTTLLAAATILREENVGAVVVLDGDHLAGVLSERDVVWALADGADPARTPVGDAMAEQPLAVGGETPIGSVAELMLSTGVRHMPVVEGTAVLGMVSMRDVFEATRDEARSRARRGG